MSIEHGTFVQKYDLLGCIQCGRCTGGCPVTVRTDLNVRQFVYDTVDDDRLEELSEKPEVWDCTTCNTCAIRCPKGLEPFEVLLGLRAMRAEEGNLEPTAISALESMFNNGNPWASPRPSASTGWRASRAPESSRRARMPTSSCTYAARPPTTPRSCRS